jgi:hypothetical protein
LTRKEPDFSGSFLFVLSEKIAAFYENCPALQAEGSVREPRLTFCDLTARVLKQGLDVLAIEVVEQMYANFSACLDSDHQTNPREPVCKEVFISASSPAPVTSQKSGGWKFSTMSPCNCCVSPSFFKPS